MKYPTVVAVLLAVAGCGSEKPAAATAEGPVSEVATIVIGDAGAAEAYHAAGTVRATRRAELATRAMARVETVRVRAGDRVRSGQVLATVERGAVTAAGSQAAAGLELATTNLRRMERLYADSAVPLAQLEASRAAFAAAQGQAEAATAELGYASITAPFDGVVIARNVDPGALATPGRPLLIVEDTGTREIVAGVPDALVRGLVVGRTLTAWVGADRQAVPVVVAAVVPSADPVSRTVEVRLTSQSPLTPGLTAIVEVPGSQRIRGQIAVPSSAVLSRGELTGVYLVGADSTARLRWVRLGRAQGDAVTVVSGLASGDVVVRDAAGVRDGMRIRSAASSGGAT